MNSKPFLRNMVGRLLLTESVCGFPLQVLQKRTRIPLQNAVLFYFIFFTTVALFSSFGDSSETHWHWDNSNRTSYNAIVAFPYPYPKSAISYLFCPTIPLSLCYFLFQTPIPPPLSYILLTYSLVSNVTFFPLHPNHKPSSTYQKKWCF